MSSKRLNNQDSCPCGSGAPFGDCCNAYLSGLVQAPTAEALMRSRYTAYVLEDGDYLQRTWHPTTREADLGLGDGTTWHGLTVVRTSGGDVDDMEGMVEFVAVCRVNGTSGTLREISRFVREDGRWYYVDGEAPKQQPVTGGRKVGRNEPCPCGSGKKYKRCCGTGT